VPSDDMTSSLRKDWDGLSPVPETPWRSDGVQSARRGLHAAESGTSSQFVPSSRCEARQGQRLRRAETLHAGPL
jgi:hypothetical protein